MPELPEVETARRGLAPVLVGARIRTLRVHRRDLRWPIPGGLEARLRGRRIEALERRAKYLLLRTACGSALIHLGMSGRLGLHRGGPGPPGPHDVWDLCLDGGTVLRYTDPRRFGALLWGGREPGRHPRLASLGPEPLEASFSGESLQRKARGRRLAVQAFLMDSRVVAGIGNIYAQEALYRAGVRPGRAAGRLSRREWEAVAAALREVLEEALRAGGTTLRDYRRQDGSPGWFQQELRVYGRQGEPCRACGSRLRGRRLGGRSSVWCSTCQH